MSQTADIIRKVFLAGDLIRDEGLQTPPTIERYDNIVYGQVDSVYQSLDVYRPKESAGKKLPVIVSVHGGGLVYGDKDRYQYYCMELADFGFAVINFSYRLAPEYKYPAPFEDTNLVFQWMFDHAEEYGLDTDHVFAVGDSAGAFILSLYAAMVTNSVLADKYSFKIPENLNFKAIGLFCGNYEVDLSRPGSEMNLGEAVISSDAIYYEFLPEGGSQKEIEAINVCPYITQDYPPTYLMTANGDFLKDQAPVLQKALFENGVPFEFQFFGGKELLFHVFHLNIRTKEARACNESLVFYFQNYLLDIA